MGVSVLTLVRGRLSHLCNLVAGLSQQTRRPDELVIAVMGGAHPRERLPALPFPVRFVDAEGPDRDLPLARARNAAARAAAHDHLVLLDVDCVPAPGLTAAYTTALDAFDGILMGEVRYLPPGAADEGWTYDRLEAVAEPHPVRPEPPAFGMERTDRYELFWSLSFGVRRGTLLDVVGGFDEGFGGYGGEDTDLAFSARAAGVPLAWLGGALVFHQHHDTYDPPLQHLEDIVENARRFREKWGVWPMEGWLGRFQAMGLVAWDRHGTVLEQRRQPTVSELEQAHRPTALPRS